MNTLIGDQRYSVYNRGLCCKYISQFIYCQKSAHIKPQWHNTKLVSTHTTGGSQGSAARLCGFRLGLFFRLCAKCLSIDPDQAPPGYLNISTPLYIFIMFQQAASGLCSQRNTPTGKNKAWLQASKAQSGISASIDQAHGHVEKHRVHHLYGKQNSGGCLLTRVRAHLRRGEDQSHIDS